MLLATLVLLRKSLRDLESIAPKLRQLGARHVAYGAQPEHYPVVAEVMLASMAEIAGDAVTTAKVKDGSLKPADFGTGQLPAGPQGLQGPRGDTGARGAQGDIGPSNGYIHPYSAVPVAIDSAQGAVVASINLRAGKYLVFARTGVGTNAATGVAVQCTLTAPNAYDYSVFDLRTGSIAESTTTLNIATTLNSPGQAQLWCRGMAMSTWAKDYSMSAIKVGQLTAS